MCFQWLQQNRIFSDIIIIMTILITSGFGNLQKTHMGYMLHLQCAVGRLHVVSANGSNDKKATSQAHLHQANRGYISTPILCTIYKNFEHLPPSSFSLKKQYNGKMLQRLHRKQPMIDFEIS